MIRLETVHMPRFLRPQIHCFQCKHVAGAQTPEQCRRTPHAFLSTYFTRRNSLAFGTQSYDEDQPIG